MRQVERLYTLDEYIDVIKRASNIHDKFTVITTNHNDVFDFNNWYCKFYKKTCLSDYSYGKNVPRSDKMSFKISTYHNFKCENSNPGVLVAKTYIGGLIEHKFRLRNTKQDLSLPIQRMNTRRPILASKMDDIQKSLKFITHEHLEYWKDILTYPRAREDIQDDQILLCND